MNVIYRAFASLLLVLSAALLLPSASAAAPAWLMSDPAEYPAAQYLIGRGAGATEEEAQNRARGDLATIFEVRIQVTNTNAITVAQSGKKEQVEKLATQQVSAKTDKVISGISIAQIWRDPATKDFHALAVLSRTQAATSLRAEIASIDEEILRQVNASQGAQDMLRKLGALSHAQEAAVRREGFQTTLKVVDPSGHGVEATLSQAAIYAQVDDVLKRIRIAPKVAEDAGNQDFASVLKGGLAAAGFLATDAEDAEFVLVGKLALTDLGRQADWNWVRATVEVSLVEKATGRVRGSKTWPVKASAQDAKTARSRALIEVEKLFKQELRSAIITFAAS